MYFLENCIDPDKSTNDIVNMFNNLCDVRNRKSYFTLFLRVYVEIVL